MQIEGSCYCGAVRFSAVSYAPYPYLRCYCSICRKTGGGGGYAINIMAQADTLKVDGEGDLVFLQARVEESEDAEKTNTGISVSPAKRYFCKSCGSALWVFDPRWAEWFYPFASAIDTPLPKPPEHVHIMLDFAAPWCNFPEGEGHRHFSRYPDEAIIDWHKRLGLYQEAKT